MLEKNAFNRLCELSKIDFSEDNQEEFTQDLNDIINFVGKVRAFSGKYDDTLENEVAYSDLRDDVEIPTASVEQLLCNTKSDKNCYIIPRVID
ncbi:MAG: aspartyl/glutamyl-tRNA amidotransferase subunit C [Oscillospiraceae bacterium]|nr:aspartyl/glutamyl-tRNA amidotransferase subunit C [Oscillospiraceae bacterium]